MKKIVSEEEEIEARNNILQVNDYDHLSSENDIEELLKTLASKIKKKENSLITAENEVKWDLIFIDEIKINQQQNLF